MTGSTLSSNVVVGAHGGSALAISGTRAVKYENLQLFDVMWV